MIFVLILVVSRKLLTGVNDFATLPKDITGWLATVTLTTAPVTSVLTINSVYWSLSYEAAFYLLLGIAIIRPWLRWPVLLFSTVLAVIHPTSPIFFLDSWTYFALGVALAELNRKLTWQALILIGLCFADFGLNRSFPQSVVAATTALAIWACTNTWGGWLNREPLIHYVGTWSYSLYLIHVPIGCLLVLNKVDPYPRVLSAGNLGKHLLIDLFALAICVAAAYWFWRWIEEPSMRKFRAPLRSRGELSSSATLQ